MHRRDWRSPAAWLVPGVLARPPAGARRGDAAAAGRRDRRAAPREEGDAGVEAVAAGPEAVADGDAQRPGEPQQPARGPAIPSTASTWAAWKRRTPVRVAGPRTPSTVPA